MKTLILATLFLCSLTTLGTPLEVNEIIKKGDLLYAQREDMNNVFKARDLFMQEFATQPQSRALLWRLSMVDYYIGHLAFQEETRKKYYREGIERAQTCIDLTKHNPKAECYFWLATNQALLKKESGIIALAFGIGDIIELLKKSKEIDPHYAGAGAYRTLALAYFKAPALFGGDSDKAFQYIKKAIKITPREPLNYYFYVKLLVEEGEKEKAMKVATDYLKANKPHKFPYFESNTAYKNLQIFQKTNHLADSDADPDPDPDKD